MSDWTLIIYCGLITFSTRFLMIALLKRDILSFVPSAIFPAIIFPAIFLDSSGLFILENNPKIFASLIAILIGVISKNIIATIFGGLAAYWILIFI